MVRPLTLALVLVAAARPAQGQQRYTIPIAEDTLLFVENQGATRILATLNGTPFKLVADSSEVRRSENAYAIPEDGDLTLDISAYMRPGVDANVIEFVSQGPAGSGFRFILAPVFAEGQTTADYALSGLRPLPSAFGLRAGPNPARGPLRVTYAVPDRRIAGLPVRVEVYDARGRRVDTVVDGVRYPGTFTAWWTGADRAGRPVAAGVYLLRLSTDEGSEVVPVTVVR